MSQQDPLKKNRLGLRGILLVCGGVLVASSVFLVPDLGGVRDSAPTTDIARPPTSAGPSSGAAGSTSPQGQAPQATPADPGTALLPVYWLGDVDGSDRLFREFLTDPESPAGDPISKAVSLMTAGQPLDPDYSSPWRPASNVTSSISTKNVITLDISSDAVAERLEEDEARLALQQLVYTATAAASNAGLITGGEASSVVVLIDGAAEYRAFGTVDIGGEWTRDPADLAPVWIIDPQEGVESGAGSLDIQGVAPASEESVSWRIDRRADDSTQGATNLFRDGRSVVSPSDGGQGAYSFSATLPPGSYEITVAASSDAALKDTKNVLIR
jgi:hypothetical protein